MRVAPAPMRGNMFRPPVSRSPSSIVSRMLDEQQAMGLQASAELRRLEDSESDRER